MRQRLDGSLQLFASDIDDREGGGDAIKSERASTTLRETEKKFASKFRRCVRNIKLGISKETRSNAVFVKVQMVKCIPLQSVVLPEGFLRASSGGTTRHRLDSIRRKRLRPSLTPCLPSLASHESRNNVFRAATRGYGAVNVALNLVEGAEGELRFRYFAFNDGLSSARRTAVSGELSNVTLLMLIGPVDHDGGQRNNPDSNVDDLGYYANDTCWRTAAWSARFPSVHFPAKGDEGQSLAFLSSVREANLRLYPDFARGGIGQPADHLSISSENATVRLGESRLALEIEAQNRPSPK
ncbi:hypothetical protein ALC57_07148 [Trachymyrmex cornetzi]|uniref:Uncharacterized protein n=1 Tax=Trachymyrmex cornetzi TaxID=471704 RepID=A0A195E5W4_9HYME|nr:hypothetical protein ALC57_07148 [Trachymyrmex cornetzi]